MRFGLRREQVGQPVRFAEIDAAMFEGAACEFSRLRRTKPIHFLQRCKYGRDNGPPSVEVKLHEVLTRNGIWRIEIQNDRPIQFRAASRQTPQGSTPWLDASSRKLPERFQSLGPADADYRNSCWWLTRRKSVDRLNHVLITR